MEEREREREEGKGKEKTKIETEKETKVNLKIEKIGKRVATEATIDREENTDMAEYVKESKTNNDTRMPNIAETTTITRIRTNIIIDTKMLDMKIMKGKGSYKKKGKKGEGKMSRADRGPHV